MISAKISFFILIYLIQQTSSQQAQDPRPTASLCPRGCHCFRTTVRCIFQQLYEIPVSQIPPDVTILDLRFNKLRRLRPDSFHHLTALQTLLLNNNELELIEDGAFAGLAQLQTLYLYRNTIRRIDKRTFEKLASLHSLFLHNNELTFIDPQAFASSPQLKRLYLNNNFLRSIPAETVESLRQLDRLRLDVNPLDCDDCQLASLADYLRRNPNLEAEPAKCQYPDSLRGTALRWLTNPDRGEPQVFSHCALPKITQQPPDNVGVRFGETVYLPCKAEGASQIVWMHNETMIQPSASNDGRSRYEIMGDGTLMIASANEAVHGYYECMAKSASGAIARARRALVRYYHDADHAAQQPRIFRTPSDAEADVGGEARFSCQADGRPTPVTSWSKDGRQLFVGAELHLRVSSV